MKLSVSKRNQLIQEIDLGKDVLAHDYSETIFLIGRSKDCHIVLDDKKISREHARIIHKSGKWFIEKTNLNNICQINGEDFDRHELESGDIFTAETFSITVMSEGQTEVSKVQDEPVVKKAPAQKIAEPEPLEKIEAPKAVTKAPIKANTTATDLNIARIETEDADEVIYDQNSTGEIDIGDLSETPATNGSDDTEFQDEPEDDLGLNLNNNESSSASLINQDTDADIVIAENNFDAPAGDENAYSLENIDSSSDDESTKVMQSFASIYLELFGDTAPYDRYIVENEKTFIGRDPAKCQIILNDTEVSTVHAVLTKNNIMVTLEDLNSSNGTIHKGDRINKVILGHNDEFVIGGVTFTLKIRSEFLKDESSTLMAVDENQTVEVEEVVEVETEEGEHLDALGQMVANEPQEKSLIKRIWKNEEQRKKLIYAVVGIVLVWVLFGPEDKPVTPGPKTTIKKVKDIPTTKTSQKKLTEEQSRSFSALYEIGKDHYQHGRYREALNELQKIAAVDPNFNSSLQSLISLSKEGLSKIEEEEKKRQSEIQSAERKAKVKALIESAREYTKDRRVDLATKTFNEITQLEPENLEVTRMKLELEDWQKEKQRKELEAATKKKEREDKVEKLKPGKTLYLQKEWFKTISKLEDFLRIKDMDDDLTTEATEMLKVSKEELNSAVAPLIGKAKSLLEGQDLKGAYEVYQQILRIEPSNSEALNQVGDIREQLATRARKIYREAIIAESLSLFQDAKEKFQEVQQISPVDSAYYKKATEKLRDYLE
ncbi:MAG: FHA domain-containing protein [Rhizobacter sp.]|nr:FHA domain-containing protein [Bacteriovorax sp.]